MNDDLDSEDMVSIATYASDELYIFIKSLSLAIQMFYSM